MKAKEFITKRRRYSLRDTIGTLMMHHARVVKYMEKGDTYRRDVSERRFAAAIEKLIYLHSGIPDE